MAGQRSVCTIVLRGIVFSSVSGKHGYLYVFLFLGYLAWNLTSFLGLSAWEIDAKVKNVASENGIKQPIPNDKRLQVCWSRNNVELAANGSTAS